MKTTIETRSILIVGVGGQGTILTSKILSTGLLAGGYDVKMSEVHGMAQRGGAVSTQVRFGSRVASPIIGRGMADVIVAFEKMEAMRWFEYLSKDGRLIVNDFMIRSAPILSGKMDYPEGINTFLTEKADTKFIDASGIATQLGNIKAANMVMFGALIKELGIDEINWEEHMESLIKPRFVALNKKAFKRGFEA